MSATTATRPPEVAGTRHPRLAERRAAVARAAGRRRLRRLLVAAGVVAAAAGALTALHSSLLAARRVEVVGAVHTPVAEVLAATGLDRHPPLIDVAPAAEEQALDRLAWVAGATIRRDWPDGVTVTLRERRPVAVLPRPGGGFDLADVTGRVLAVTARPPSGLLEVLAPTGTAAPAGALPAVDGPLLAVAAGLAPALRPAVAAVVSQPGMGILLRLRAGPEAVLGSAAHLAEQSIALATVLAKVSLHGIVTIDLRVPDAPVLTP